jgi:hypothetical protein
MVLGNSEGATKHKVLTKKRHRHLVEWYSATVHAVSIPLFPLDDERQKGKIFSLFSSGSDNPHLRIARTQRTDEIDAQSTNTKTGDLAMSSTRIVSLLLLGMLLFAGCNVDMHDETSAPVSISSSEAELITPPIGGPCIVKYRPDACGADAPVSVDTTMSNGVDYTLSGTLLAVDDDWVVVEVYENGKYEYWIPRSDVFFIRAARPKDKPESASQTVTDRDGAEHADEAVAETSASGN